MREYEIDNELKETMLFDSYANATQIFENIIARATKDEPEEVPYVKLKTKLGNLWIIRTEYTSQYAVRYDGVKFYATPGYNMENIYVTMDAKAYNEAVEALDSKGGKQYYKELQAWLLSSFKNIAKGKTAVGKIHTFPTNRNCIFDFFTYNVVAA